MLESNALPSEDPTYKELMQTAKLNMQVALQKLQKDLIPKIPKDKHTNLINLSLNRKDVDPHLFCFDDVWDSIQKIFDAIRNDFTPEQTALQVGEFKKLIFKLVDAGIPLQTNKELNFWSTQFARVRAEAYSEQTGSTTDAMVVSNFRKILLEWPEEDLLIFFPLIRTYGEISLVLWTALSDIYLDCTAPGSEAHVFFQDAMIEGNYFWNVELPKAREKNLQLIIHVYDTETQQWKAPVKFDSKEGNEIFVRRRKIHPDDGMVDEKNIFISSLKEKLWLKTFKDGPDSASPLTFWSSPKKITIGKLRNISQKIIQHHQDRNKKKP